MWLIHSNMLLEVRLEFLVRGHSYMPCDRVFGVLEKKFRNYEHIDTPGKYRDIINSTTVSTSVTMEHADLLNFKELLNHIQFRTAKEVYFSKSRQIHLSVHRPWDMYLITPQGNEYVDLNKRSNRTDEKTLLDFMDHRLNPKYELGQQISIGQSKVLHLKQLFPYLSVPGRQWVQMVEQGQQTAGPRPRADRRLPPHIQIPPDAQGQQDIDADYYEDIPEPNMPPGYADDPSEQGPSSSSQPTSSGQAASGPQQGPSSSSQPTASGQAASGKGRKRKSATETASDKSGKRQKKK